jgi:hypothetical protein
VVRQGPGDGPLFEPAAPAVEPEPLSRPAPAV